MAHMSAAIVDQAQKKPSPRIPTAACPSARCHGVPRGFVQSAAALRMTVSTLAQGGAAAQPATWHLVGEPQRHGCVSGSRATLTGVAARAQRIRRKEVQQQQPRLVMRAVAAAKSAAPVHRRRPPGCLKMRCNAYDAGCAIYWAKENGKLVVASEYVSGMLREEMRGSAARRACGGVEGLCA